MSRLLSIAPKVLLLALPLALGGCAGLIIGGLAAAGGAGYVAAQERGVNGIADDVTTKSNIRTGWSQTNPAIDSDVTATVYQGRVLLTGTVPYPRMKEQAKDIASRTAGVRAVYDQIIVGPPPTTAQIAKDTWITTRLRSDLIFDSAIRSNNYTIETANQSVYLIGSARTQAELDRATQIARYVPDVRRVVSYVEIRSGEPVGTAQAAEPPAVGGPPPGGSVADPAAPVQVQKL